MAKLVLNKHQRTLVTSFMKYQIDDLGTTAEGCENTDRSTLLQPGIQEDGTVAYDFAAMEGLTEAQRALLQEVADEFNPEEEAADMAILYEVTGFQTESHNFQFWDNYRDFEELGETKLVRNDKNEEKPAQLTKSPLETS